MRSFAEAAASLRPTRSPDRSAWITGARRSYEVFSTPPAVSPHKVDVARVVHDLSERLPANAIISNGAGTYTGYVHRYYRFRDYGSQLAPTSGAMGYGLPAAVAAKVVFPDRPAVCFAGDGCFLMASQELATAMMYDLPIIVIVIDNASYGSIRGHQERRYPGRVVGTDLLNPDFAALAKAYGAYAEVVESTDAFAGAFERAVASRRAALLTFKLDINTLVANNARTS
jgi:acetolactate synthase-1/2/3 large subunit